jgi:transcriptional regulator with XRE-family HTH domain
LGRIIRQHRVLIPLTLQELAQISGVSPSYLGRIEKNERFPSASILRKIAQPLGFNENELFILAGYLPPQSDAIAEASKDYNHTSLDPHIARELAKEPIEMQFAALTILSILKSLNKMKK